MSIKVFTVGRPGCGKTTAVNYILKYAASKGLSTDRFKDYEILYSMFKKDMKQECQNNSERKFRKAEYGGFDVLDNTIFDLALEQLAIDVLASPISSSEGIITVEFARDDYQDALCKLNKFHPGFLKNAYLLFIDCNVEKCIERIYRRISNPPKPDFHFVSERIMQSYYSKENLDYMLHDCEAEFSFLEKIEVIENTKKMLEEFMEKVAAFAEVVVEAAHKEMLVPH